jgi:hypothetical protein
MDADVGDPARRDATQVDREAIRVFSCGQALELVPFTRWKRSDFKGFPPRTPKAFEVEPAGSCAILGAKGPREVGARREPAGERDGGEARAVPMREKIDRAFEPDPLHEGGQCLTHQRAKDPVEMVGGKTGRLRHLFEP